MSNKEEILLDGKAVNMLKETVGGSTVVANPELEGTEPNLEGLEVGGVKYKVPEGGGEGIEFVEISPDGGTLEYDDYQKLINGAYIKFAQTQEAEFNGSEVICLPNHQVDELVYSSVVKDGKYYQVEFTVDHIEFECTYEVKILDAIEYVILDGMSGYINVDNGDYQKLLNGAYIKLISGGEEEMMYGDNTVLVPNHGNYDLVYSSTIRDGKYLQFEIDSSVVSEFGMAYTITEVSVGGKDNRFLGLGFELKSALSNKHLSVNALLSLLEKYGIDASNIYNLHIGSVVSDNNAYELINACFDGSTSAITILEVQINDGEYYNSINQGLIAIKNQIENHIIGDNFPLTNLYCANLSTESDVEGSIFISPEEIYGLFTQ